ncbi:MAG: asparaginase [Myxococcota bacterium]|jgi:L-asparaginase|nr:asparaginase [Myxococcota bacterium]
MAKTRKPRVLIVYTGGTIGMAPSEPDNPISPLTPQSFKALKRYAPALNELAKRVVLDEVSPFDPPLDSSNVTSEHWVTMARTIRDAYDDHDGFVILHGTDTLAYTASALAFMFRNLAKPVVVTGSQLPISDIRTDATGNLISAIYLAGYRAFGLPRVPEVVVCFADKVLRGCRATKSSASQFDGFDSPNFPPLGTIGEHIVIHEELLMPAPPDDAGLILQTDLVTDVMNVVVFPGIRGDHLERAVLAPDVQGVIIHTFGTGNAPTRPELLEVIERAVDSGRTVLNVTQCQQGTVEMGLYAAGSALLEKGVVSGLDMTAEAALTKLMWTLGTQYGSGIASQLQINQRGEQSENLFELAYSEATAGQVAGRHVAPEMPDGRLQRDHLSRAHVRLVDVGLVGAEVGDTVRLNLFVHKPRATHRTPTRDPMCLGTIEFVWKGHPRYLVADVTRRLKPVIGRGEIPLTVVSADPQVRVHFSGLYLSLFSKSRDRKI